MRASISFEPTKGLIQEVGRESIGTEESSKPPRREQGSESRAASLLTSPRRLAPPLLASCADRRLYW